MNLEFASCVEFLETLDSFLSVHHRRHALTLLHAHTVARIYTFSHTTNMSILCVYILPAFNCLHKKQSKMSSLLGFLICVGLI